MINGLNDPQWWPGGQGQGWGQGLQGTAAEDPNWGETVGFMAGIPGMDAPTGYHSIPGYASTGIGGILGALTGIPGIGAAMRGVIGPAISQFTGWGKGEDPWAVLQQELERFQGQQPQNELSYVDALTRSGWDQSWAQFMNDYAAQFDQNYGGGGQGGYSGTGSDGYGNTGDADPI
jgi:hypothetical protein